MIGGGQTGCVFMRWDQWGNSNTDFDLFLTNPANTVTVAQGTNSQTGTQAPVEQACFNNTGATATFHLFIQRFAGTGTPRMDLFTNNGVFATQYSVPSSSILDPAASTSAFTAGAICFQNDSLEPYSSQGPTIDGRVKPDIAGQDAVTSGVYGPFSTCGSSGFTGTSAASPHTAGAAALVKEVNPSFTAAQLRSFLRGRAGELGAAGPDNLFGAGKLLLGAPSLPPTVTTGAASGVTSRGRDAGGHRQPAGRADDLPLPVRPDRRLRQPDRRRPRRRWRPRRRPSPPPSAGSARRRPTTTGSWRATTTGRPTAATPPSPRRRPRRHHAPAARTERPAGRPGATGAGGSTGGPAPARPAATSPS